MLNLVSADALADGEGQEKKPEGKLIPIIWATPHVDDGRLLW